MVYLDTSFIAPVYVEDVHSEKVEAALSSLASMSLYLSDWTIAEFASLLGLRVRMGVLDHAFALETMQLFHDDAHSSLTLVEPTRPDFEQAAAWLLEVPRLGLRTPDALHLAVAARHELTTYTLDKTLLDAAAKLGVRAVDGGVL